MGGIFGARWRWMLEAVKGGCNVVGHGNVTGAAEVIPFQVQAEVGGAGPFGSDGVEGAEGGEEVLGMRSSDGLDAEVVNDEGEGMGRVGCRQSPGVWRAGA